MAKENKKTVKSIKAKKPTVKAKSAVTKVLKADAIVATVETPKAEEFNRIIEVPKQTTVVTPESELSVEEDDTDMDSVGNKVDAGPNAGGILISERTTIARPGVHAEPGEEYNMMVHFDKVSAQYVASILEFPELSVSGPNKGNVLLELQDKLETQMMEVKRLGQSLPEPIQAKKYPEILEVPVSQGLFRKLDILSRQEKVAIEKLVSEIIAGAVERRFEGKRQGDNRPPQNFSQNNQPRHNNNNRDQRHHNNNNRDRHQQNNRRPQQGYSNPAAGGQDNFMEYVRNLEKGGGSNWKKR